MKAMHEDSKAEKCLFYKNETGPMKKSRSCILCYAFEHKKTAVQGFPYGGRRLICQYASVRIMISNRTPLYVVDKQIYRRVIFQMTGSIDERGRLRFLSDIDSPINSNAGAIWKLIK